ncbi:MAG TPA: DUF3800 domain-containing protein [Beijerinckiaceae bacterium]|jgi:hypothetical protein
MFIFIDESGDAGFKLTSGSSARFVIVLVLFRDAAHRDFARSRIEQLRAELGFQNEFRFSKSSDRMRDRFFEMLGGCALEVRALVIRKELVRSAEVLRGGEAFYDVSIRAAIEHCASDVVDAEVVIDGRGERRFARALQAHGRKPFIRRVSFRDSRKEPLVQLADMAAGGIARAYRNEGAEHRWMAMLSKHGQLGRIHLWPG